jgi:hypothetical protein
LLLLLSLSSNQIGKHPRAAHQAFESQAFTLMTPPNFGSGCWPVMAPRADFGHLWDAEVQPGARRARKPVAAGSIAQYSRSKLCFAEGVVRALDAEYSD